jgi:hypothetical protein
MKPQTKAHVWRFSEIHTVHYPPEVQIAPTQKRPAVTSTVGALLCDGAAVSVYRPYSRVLSKACPASCPESVGVEFIADNGGGPGVRLIKRVKWADRNFLVRKLRQSCDEFATSKMIRPSKSYRLQILIEDKIWRHLDSFTKAP